MAEAYVMTAIQQLDISLWVTSSDNSVTNKGYNCRFSHKTLEFDSWMQRWKVNVFAICQHINATSRQVDTGNFNLMISYSERRTWSFEVLSVTSPLVRSTSVKRAVKSSNCCSVCFLLRSASWRAVLSCFSSAAKSTFSDSSVCFVFSNSAFAYKTITHIIIYFIYYLFDLLCVNYLFNCFNSFVLIKATII